MIDKEKFGAFVAQLRKEQGLTQKELAERLFLSDKAVSKWERGLSMPDIEVLTPLAELLHVSVAELLQGERMPPKEAVAPEQVEELLQNAISLSESPSLPGWKQPKRWLTLLLTWLIVAVEWSVLSALKHDPQVMSSEMGVFLLLSFIFGLYFFFIVQERLPKYYDENEIRYYHHNGMKMNIPGVRLNNSNWPHIVKTLRAWCIYLPVTVPLIFGIGHRLLLQSGIGIVIAGKSIVLWLLLIYALTSLFMPLIIIGKKYE